MMKKRNAPNDYTIDNRNDFGVKFILEVCGGAGAVWGWSEVAAIRTSDTLWFWRPFALLVAFVFYAQIRTKNPCEDKDQEQGCHHTTKQNKMNPLFRSTSLDETVDESDDDDESDDANESIRSDGKVMVFLDNVNHTAASAVINDENNDQHDLENPNNNTISNFSIYHLCNNTRIHRLPIQKQAQKAFSVLLQQQMRRLILEVCGGTGAVWGFAEIIGLRTTENAASLWRPIASLTCVVFLLRWIVQTTNELINSKIIKYPSQSLPQPQKQSKKQLPLLPLLRNSYQQQYSTSLGGEKKCLYGSAVGKNNSNNECRENEQDEEQGASLPASTNSIATRLEFLHVMIVRWILDVAGASGAIWGFSEIIQLRTTETDWFWRIIALAVGMLFWCRYIKLMSHYSRNIDSSGTHTNSTSSRHTDNMISNTYINPLLLLEEEEEEEEENDEEIIGAYNDEVNNDNNKMMIAAKDMIWALWRREHEAKEGEVFATRMEKSSKGGEHHDFHEQNMEEQQQLLHQQCSYGYGTTAREIVSMEGSLSSLAMLEGEESVECEMVPL